MQTFKTPMEAKLDLPHGSKDDLPDVPYAQWYVPCFSLQDAQDRTSGSR